MDRFYDLHVTVENHLSLPPQVLQLLKLEPGSNLLTQEPSGRSLRLELYSEFLNDNWHAIASAHRWKYLYEFLSRPLTAVGPDGLVPISSHLFPLREGETVSLQVMNRGLTHTLFLFRDDSGESTRPSGRASASAIVP